jgi:predicted dehydrogenase
MMKKTLNVGLIGLGLGSKYAEYLAHHVSGAKLMAVCDINSDLVEEYDEPFGAAKYTNYQDLIAAKEVDVIVIVTPTNTHKEVTIESAKTGKPIFCEKPLCLTLEEAIEVQQTVDYSLSFFLCMAPGKCLPTPHGR